MSEFKFLCPVCGQHIATDSNVSGAQIECPTCFQKIVVPQAPATPSKYILSATQYIKPQLVSPTPAVAPRAASRFLSPQVFLCLLGLCILAVAWLMVRQSAARRASNAAQDAGDAAMVSDNAGLWRLDVSQMNFPDRAAAGYIHDKNFLCERAYLQDGTLALRQGSRHRTEAILNVYFSLEPTQGLDGKVFVVPTNGAPGVQKIVLRWKEGGLRVSQSFTNGYALKVTFGASAGGNIPGRIYLCAPDGSRSYVAGSFNAEIKRLSAQRQQ